MMRAPSYGLMPAPWKYWELKERREKIVDLAIRAGKDMDTALAYAEQAVPKAEMEAALEAFNIKEKARREACEKPDTRKSWISNLFNWSKAS